MTIIGQNEKGNKTMTKQEQISKFKIQRNGGEIQLTEDDIYELLPYLKTFSDFIDGNDALIAMTEDKFGHCDGLEEALEQDTHIPIGFSMTLDNILYEECSTEEEKAFKVYEEDIRKLIKSNLLQFRRYN